MASLAIIVLRVHH